MRIDKEKYTSHIKDNEKLIEMRKLIDKIEMVSNNHYIESTDFLDPYERVLAKSILNRFSDINYLESGGREDTERQIIIIYPSYHDFYSKEDHLSAIRITGIADGLSHKDFLGAILNLGIKRGKIGDILIHRDYVDIVAKKEISDFILLNLEKISNKKIQLENISLDLLQPVESQYKTINTTLSSCRLDVYISSIYNLSRQDSVNLIKSGYIKINWEQIEKPSRELEVGDVVSTRGYGRSIFYAQDGLSKKGKVKATIRILI